MEQKLIDGIKAVVIKLKRTDLLVIKAPASSAQDQLVEIMTCAQSALADVPEKPPIMVMTDEMQIESISEETMLRYGWVRAQGKRDEADSGR